MVSSIRTSGVKVPVIFTSGLTFTLFRKLLSSKNGQKKAPKSLLIWKHYSDHSYNIFSSTLHSLFILLAMWILPFILSFLNNAITIARTIFQSYQFSKLYSSRIFNGQLLSNASFTRSYLSQKSFLLFSNTFCIASDTPPIFPHV